MIGEHPIKQILVETRSYWDHEGTATNVRENFLKVIQCGTIALGAEIFASQTESKLVYHTCKSRFCTSCGQRATESWQEDLEAILPDVPYIGITLTMPIEIRGLFEQNRHLLHGIPAMGAEAIIQCAKARSGAHLLVLVVQQTFRGLLNFVPHLHVMVSAGGLQESTNRWIPRLRLDEEELMRAWRYALIAFLAEANKRNILRSDLTSDDLLKILATQYKRRWNVFISRAGSRAYRLKHDGRYVRRPPIAQHRLTRIGKYEVEYLAKNTRDMHFVATRYTNEEFIKIWVQHGPDRGCHAMRYFGLLSPRSKARLWSAIFVLVNQQQRPLPPRTSWRWLHLKTFGTDPLQDSFGRSMHWVGRRAPFEEA